MKDFSIFWNDCKIFGLKLYKFWVGLNRRYKIGLVVTLVHWVVYLVSKIEWWKILFLNVIIVYAVFWKKKKKGS